MFIMKNLLITGGCGFIGSNFVNHFFEFSNCNIVNLDAMYYCANETNVNEHIRNSSRYKFIKGKLCSLDLVRHVLDCYSIDTIIHFVAQSHDKNSLEDTLQYTSDNVVGTHTLLECARRYGKIERFIHISTDELYGKSVIEENQCKKKSDESILSLTNPYAASKDAAELIAKSYYHSFKMPIVITRVNNVYGPNQHPEKLIPFFIKQLLDNKPVTIQGNGSNIQSFLHVNDVCSALTLILEKGVIGEIYNIGSDRNDEYTVLQIAHMLIVKTKGTSHPEKWITYNNDRPLNDNRYYISNEKVKALGWNILMNFNKGIDILLQQMFTDCLLKIYNDHSNY
jgi:dTDP-glucose 4,6-dehydratase